MQHVIIGAGPAGVIAAETVRKLDAAADITIVGDEPEPPYSRMAIPYYLVDQIGEAGTHLRKDPAHYDSSRIHLVRDRVERVAGAERRLELASGGTLTYDKLLIATGSQPVKPPIGGIDLPGVHACWTLEDGRQIVARVGPGAKVVLMGAGFIGSIILEALAERGVDLTVLEMGDRMVPRMMDQFAGGLLKTWCERKGVTVLTSTRAAGIESGNGGQPLTVALEGGAHLPADLVIRATGVVPNSSVVDGTSVQVDQGILVDEYLQTADPHIFAAGDVAQGKDFCSGEYSVQAVQPTAADHGRIAATNMVRSRSLRHQGSVNMNVLDTLGLISCSFGLWQGVDGGDGAELADADRFRYVSLRFRDDVLVGANTVGMTQHVGVLRGLIQTGTHLGKWKDRLMRDPTAVMAAYLGATQS